MSVYNNEQIDIDDLRTKITGIVLSGGTGDPYEPLNLTANFVVLQNLEVPTMGICLGHEILAAFYAGLISPLPQYQDKEETITLHDPKDPLFKDISDPCVLLQEKHHSHVSRIPQDFVCLGSSEICPFEIIRHKDKPLYGFQSHPEILQNKNAQKIMENFLDLCKIPVSFS